MIHHLYCLTIGDNSIHLSKRFMFGYMSRSQYRQYGYRNVSTLVMKRTLSSRFPNGLETPIGDSLSEQILSELDPHPVWIPRGLGVQILKPVIQIWTPRHPFSCFDIRANFNQTSSDTRDTSVWIPRRQYMYTCCPGSNASTLMRSSILRVFSNPSSNLTTYLTPSSEMESITPEKNREKNESKTISSCKKH